MGNFVVSQLLHLSQRFEITVLVPYFVPVKELFLPRSFPSFQDLEVHYVKNIAYDLYGKRTLNWMTVPEMHLAIKRRAAMSLLARAQALHTQRPFALVYGHEAFIGDEAASIGEKLGIPSFFTLHSFFDYRLSQIGELAMRAIMHNLSQCTQLISVSQRALDSYAVHGLTTANAKIIPNGVDLPKQEHTLRKMIGINQDDLCLLSVGSFTPEKRFNQSIETLYYLHQHGFPSAHLLLIGKGQEETHLKELSHRLGVFHFVHFCGEVQPHEMSPYYATADMLIHPSIIESFSMVCLEAMAHGLPIICTKNIGLIEFIDTRIEALVIPPDDSDALHAAVAMLAADPKKRAIIGKAARQRAALMTWDKQSAIVINLFNRYGENA